VYNQRRSNPDFRRAWNKATTIGTELLEREAERRAYHGTEKPVFHKGQQCGTITEYSDGLMTFLLKARRPEVYRDMIEQGKGATVNVSVQTNLAAVNLLNKLLAGGELGEIERAELLEGTVNYLPAEGEMNKPLAVSEMSELSPSPIHP
jgi:hypothetical protein